MLGSYGASDHFLGDKKRAASNLRDINEAIQWFSVASSQCEGPRAKDQSSRVKGHIVSVRQTMVTISWQETRFALGFLGRPNVAGLWVERCLPGSFPLHEQD